MIERFFSSLKESLETHSHDLSGGRLFLPEFLKDKVFTKRFRAVMQTLASNLGLSLAMEVRNELPVDYECGSYQMVDYVLSKQQKPIFYVEVESLDRAQFATFREHEDIRGGWADNKLWYYCGTVGKSISYGQTVPPYFVWLLILPDQRVEPYQIWDATSDYVFFHPSLKPLIFESPYRFYDHAIKTTARLFLQEKMELKDRNTDRWLLRKLANYQDVCELVFITCTVDHLILSRGKDLFDARKEEKTEIRWK